MEQLMLPAFTLEFSSAGVCSSCSMRSHWMHEGCTTRGLRRPSPARGHTGGCACAVLPCSL
eukprot:7852202-Alexandrium_andersonii.AAC.1